MREKKSKREEEMHSPNENSLIVFPTVCPLCSRRLCFSLSYSGLLLKTVWHNRRNSQYCSGDCILHKCNFMNHSVAITNDKQQKIKINFENRNQSERRESIYSSKQSRDIVRLPPNPLLLLWYTQYFVGTSKIVS